MYPRNRLGSLFADAKYGEHRDLREHQDCAERNFLHCGYVPFDHGAGARYRDPGGAGAARQGAQSQALLGVSVGQLRQWLPQRTAWLAWATADGVCCLRRGCGPHQHQDLLHSKSKLLSSDHLDALHFLDLARNTGDVRSALAASCCDSRSLAAGPVGWLAGRQALQYQGLVTQCPHPPAGFLTHGPWSLRRHGLGHCGLIGGLPWPAMVWLPLLMIRRLLAAPKEPAKFVTEGEDVEPCDVKCDAESPEAKPQGKDVLAEVV
mmetsp:Transcript_19862/g.43840  ORF Transcript_19862/g.43840 Transcript_19862/m.43840 type:complete len:263 (-) Transcript_19862:105-893(-)